MNVVTVHAGNFAEMRGVRIRLIGTRFGRELRVGTVAFCAHHGFWLSGRRAFRMADRATQAGRDMLVDKKAVSNTGRGAYQQRRCHLSGGVGEKSGSSAHE
jgi:hypothetical protein